MKRFLTYLMVFVTVLSCSTRLEMEGPLGMDPSLEGKPVTVTFSVPDVRLSPMTKTLEDGDGLISGAPYLDPDKFYLVVCGSTQSIKYIRKAEVVTDDVTGEPITTEVPVSSIPGYPLTDGAATVNMYTFRVQLELSDQSRTIHFLGNIDERQLNTGSYAYQALPSMSSYEGKQAYWQEVILPSIGPRLDSGNHPIIQNGSYLPSEETEAALSCVPLIRNYAKIEVTDATSAEDQFELYSYAVINYPRNGSVTPYRSNVDNLRDAFNFNARGDEYRFSGYERCTFQDLDDELSYLGQLTPKVTFDNEIPSAAMFEHPETSGGRVLRYDKNNPDLGFYLYERGVPTEALEPTYVIIRGRFGSSNEYFYYRLDLMETKMVNFESVYQYYPIYRNFRYNIQLNRISSVGVSTPEAAANSSGAEDISADISMRHLSDISNGRARLVVEPFMSKTYTGPNEEGYYYIYARFFNDLNSSEPNVDWGAVSVELLPMEDQSDDILLLYDDVGNDVHAFYPSSQVMGGEPGFRVIRFNTKAAGTETKTQKIRVTGRNLYAHEEYPLYREVEITLQKKQTMVVTCVTPELPAQKGARQEVRVTIPAGLPESMFPLEFTIEAEKPTLTPDNGVAGNNLPVSSGPSISDDERYSGKNTIQFIRTLSLDEYNSLEVQDGQCTFSSYFKSNRAKSETTIWVSNDYFVKGHASFINMGELTGHFYIKINDDADTNCMVVLNNGNNFEYNIDETGWLPYTGGQALELERGHQVAFRSVVNVFQWTGGNKIFCYKKGSAKEARNGQFSVGGNLASLLIGDNFVTDAATLGSGWSFIDLFKNHTNLTDASELILPMMTLQTNCYKSMFDGCTSLVSGPRELPATKLGDYCYRNMFLNCSSLVNAPYLPAETINNSCYQRMFEGCSSLQLIKMNSSTYKSGAFTDWVKNVAPTGEIWLNPAIQNSVNYERVVPVGWETTVKKLPDGESWF